MFRSPLQRAIARGLRPGGNLAKELSSLDGDYEVSSRRDALAVCQALRQYPFSSPGKDIAGASALFRLAVLFQRVPNAKCEAAKVFREQGIPELIRIFDLELRNSERDEDCESDLVFLLKLFAAYGSLEGAKRIVQGVRARLAPGEIVWFPVFSVIAQQVPRVRDFVFEQLSRPLVPEPLAVPFLEGANEAAIYHGLRPHPADQPAGWDLLRRWLSESIPEEESTQAKEEKISLAHTAAAALPFLSPPARDELLALALDHESPRVQMEAAWAAAKLGREAGLKILARFATEVEHAEVARRYLDELGREDVLPPELNDPDYQALAEFSHWLQHPNELGCPPDELEVVDRRYLRWPPEYEEKPFWVLRYLLRSRDGLEPDNVDCGLVGSVTWCFFYGSMHRRPPEDVYAIHCGWEMETFAKLIQLTSVPRPREYASLLAQWRGPRLQKAQVTAVAELSPKLQAPTTVVAVARAVLEGKPGWVVLAGPHSAWYPKEEQPDSHDETVLRLHIGRILLGFEDQPDRQRYLAQWPASPPLPPSEKFLPAYQQALQRLAQYAKGELPPPKDTMDRWHLANELKYKLKTFFPRYVELESRRSGRPQAEVLCQVYQYIWRHTRRLPKDMARELDDALYTLLGQYVRAQQERGRKREALRYVAWFAARCDLPGRHVELAHHFRRLGKHKRAVWHLEQAYQQIDSPGSIQELVVLARHYHRRGQSQKAQELLRRCIRDAGRQLREASCFSGARWAGRRLRLFRRVYRELFPPSGPGAVK